jgi:hypothetical protein
MGDDKNTAMEIQMHAYIVMYNVTEGVPQKIEKQYNGDNSGNSTKFCPSEICKGNQQKRDRANTL